MLTNPLTRRLTGPPDLIDLLGECHGRIRRFIALAREAAARTDAPSGQVIEACAEVERYFRQALPLHVADEEESIAPRLHGLSAEVDRALGAMEEQHQRHAAKLAVFLRALAEVRGDPRDTTRREPLARAAQDLETEFEEHLSLEETVIFPAIRQFFSHETQTLILDELRRRRH